MPPLPEIYMDRPLTNANPRKHRRPGALASTGGAMRVGQDPLLNRAGALLLETGFEPRYPCCPNKRPASSC